MKILAVVVSYYPDLELLSDNINRFINFVDCVLIWENTPVPYNLNFQLAENKKIIYVGEGVNVGISKALNYAVDFSQINKFDLLLTMDQDSLFEDFSHYITSVRKVLEKTNVGCLTPNPNKRFFVQNDAFQYLDPITSGAIYKVDVFCKVGRFNEYYFIDAIDTEFCYRLYIAGILTVCLSDSLLIQKFGDTQKTKYSFFTYNYSSFRVYYIIRNHILLWKKYSNVMPLEKKKWFIHEMIIKWPIKILLSETNKIQKIKSLIKGCFHGLFTSI